MRDIVSLYVLRYGLTQLLTEVGVGLSQSTEEYGCQLTEEGKHRVIDTAVEILEIRNRQAKEDRAKENLDSLKQPV